jgi:hypothetical protein
MSVRRPAALAASAVVVIAVTSCAEDSRPSDRTSRGGESAIAHREQSREHAEREPRERVEASEKTGYRADLARIERAKPEPLVGTSPGERLKHAKKIKTPSGATYYVTPDKTERTATAPTSGCDSGRPQPPGVTARRIGPTRLLVTYQIGGGDEECRAQWIEVTADVSDDFLPGDGRRFPIADKRSGQIVLVLGRHVVDADVLVASTRTKENSGPRSRTTTTRIR